MLLRELYKNLHTLVNKEGKENLISMDEFNTLIKQECSSFVRDKIRELYKISPDGALDSQTLMSSSFIAPLITFTTTSFSAGALTVPAAYMYWLSMYTTTAINGQLRELELVSDNDFVRKIDNIYPFDEHPCVVIRGTNVFVYPSNIVNVRWSYIHKPTTPFLDYYIDANYEKQYLGAGATYVLQAGEVYRDGTTEGEMTSITVELEFPDDFHDEFLYRLLDKISNKLDDVKGIQYAMTKQND